MPSAVPALCDSGPLVSIFDKSEDAHEECTIALKRLEARLITTWPVLTEAFHFLQRPAERNVLWAFILSGALDVSDILTAEMPRLRWLMAKYADLPMDLADASLVVVGERLKLRKVFTLDRHFRLYRPRHIRAFDIIP